MAGRTFNPFLRYPRASLLLAIALCLPIFGWLTRFEFDAEARVLLGGDQRNLASYDKVREILGESEAVAISLEVDNLFTLEGLDRVRQISDAFAARPDVLLVHSLTHSFKPVRRGVTFDMMPLVPPGAGPEDVRKLRAFCLSHPLVRNLLVAADGRHTLVTVYFARRAVTAEQRRVLRTTIDSTLAPFRAAGSPMRVLALPLIEDELRGTLAGDLRRFVPLAAAIVSGALWLTFRSWGLVLLVLVNQAVALALLPGLTVATGAGLNVFTLLLLPLLSGIQLTLLAHLITALQGGLAQGQDAATALAEAVRLTWTPSSFATLTTVVGLLSLAASGIPQIRTFGLLGAAGLTAIHLLTYGPTLAMLAIAAPFRSRGIGTPSDRESVPSMVCSADFSRPGSFELPEGGARNPDVKPAEDGGPAASRGASVVPWDALVRFGLRRRRWVLVAGAGALVVAGVGLTRLRTDIRAVEFLSPASPTRQALEELDRVWGGINVVQIAFDTGRAGGANDLAFLRYLEAVHRHAEAMPDLAAAYSYAQLMAMINQVWEGGASEALRLPSNPLLLRLFLIALKSYELPFLRGLADGDFRTAQLVLRTRDLPSSRYLGLIHNVLAFADQTRPTGVTVSAAEGIHSILEADRQILRSQTRSAGLTVGVIFVTLALLWRSWRLPLLALSVNLVPVGVVIAGAAWFDVPLNSITVMVGAVSLGIAVDDSIHFLTHWREARRSGVPPDAAIRQTLALKGRAIVWTSLILVGVCSVFWFSSFPPVREFGVLSAAAFVAALASVLGLLPAALFVAAPALPGRDFEPGAGDAKS